MAEAKELSIDDLRSLARKVDAGEAVEIPETPPDVTPSDSSTEEAPLKTPSQDEIEKALGEGEPEEEQAPKSSDTTPEKSAELTKEKKEQERYDRNWKKLQEEKAELEKQKKELAAEMAKTAKTRDLKDEQDDEGYSVKDYEYAVRKFQEDGNEELAGEANRKAKDLYFQAFQKSWKVNMDELIDQYPDLSDSRKPFTITCDKVLKTLPFLQTIPDGCKYAVRIALGDTSSGMVSELQAENQKLKQEVDKLNRATRLSGSLPSRLPQGKTFDDLPPKERLNHLRELAEAADRGEL